LSKYRQYRAVEMIQDEAAHLVAVVGGNEDLEYRFVLVARPYRNDVAVGVVRSTFDGNGIPLRLEPCLEGIIR
jgi:hypothetical protein